MAIIQTITTKIPNKIPNVIARTLTVSKDERVGEPIHQSDKYTNYTLNSLIGGEQVSEVTVELNTRKLIAKNL